MTEPVMFVLSQRQLALLLTAAYAAGKAEALEEALAAFERVNRTLRSTPNDREQQ